MGISTMSAIEVLTVNDIINHFSTWYTLAESKLREKESLQSEKKGLPFDFQI